MNFNMEQVQPKARIAMLPGFVALLGVMYAGLLAAAFCDTWLGDLNLFIVTVVVFGMVATAVVALQPTRLRWGLLAVYLMALVLMWPTAWNSRKAFLRDLDRVRPGMTIEKVQTVMDGYMVGWNGTEYPGRAVGKAEGEINYRHSHTPEFGGDIGTVSFKDGKVTRVSFSPD